MKQTQSNTRKVRSQAAKAAAMVAAGMPSPNITGTTENVGKKGRGQKAVPAGRSDAGEWKAKGAKEAAALWTADRAADEERCKILTNLSVFAPFGWGESTGKKKALNVQAENYFTGWKEYRDSLPETEKKAFGVRYAEARRVCYAFIHYYTVDKNKGVEHVNGILTGPGTYHQKIGALPTMTKGGQGKGARTGGKAKGNNTPANSPLANMAKAQDEKAAAEIVQNMGDKEVGLIVKNLPTHEIPALLNALTIRLNVEKDKVLKDLGKKIKALLDSARAAKHLKEVAIVDPKASQAAAA